MKGLIDYALDGAPRVADINRLQFTQASINLRLLLNRALRQRYNQGGSFLLSLDSIL